MQGLSLTLCLTGECRHPEHSTRRDRKMNSARYPMYAAVIDRGGDRIVFDPGYAPRLLEATNPFPERFYRWATPMQIAPEKSLACQLDAQGLRASVSHVIISHFHADHVAGLIDFPQARIITSRSAWVHFCRFRGLSAVRRGYVRALVPDNMESRLTFIEDTKRVSLHARLSGFEDGFDLFGDGSLILLPLPGHSAGQCGAFFSGSDGADRFLIADATWSIEGLQDDAPPPSSTLHFIGHKHAYLETWHRLRRLTRQRPDIRLIPSHCATAAARESQTLV